MRNYKRILAVGLAAAMVMGSSAVAFAAEGAGSGTGSLDIVEKSDVFDVVLPLDSGTTFNYILDPTGVIKATGAEKYSGATFADGKTVFFANAATTEGGSVSYSDTSDAIKAENKSTMDVTIKVSAKVAAVEGITMANSATFDSADTSASLYLALKDDNASNTDKAITTDGVEVTSTIEALDDAYETKYEDGKYVKKLKTDATGFKTYSFQLTGACNPKGEWTGLTETPPAVSLVWSIEDPTAPKGPQVTLSEAGLITVTGLTADANVKDANTDITLGVDGAMYPMDGAAADWDTSAWDTNDGGTLKAQLKGDYKVYNNQEVTVSIKLSNGKTITCSETIEIAE